MRTYTVVCGNIIALILAKTKKQARDLFIAKTGMEVGIKVRG